MEDRWAVGQESPNGAAVLGVFDGHGGAKVSQHLAERLPSDLLSALRGGPADVADAIRAVFLATDAEIVRDDLATGAPRSNRVPGPGSTAAVALLQADGAALWLANVGDARAVLVDENGTLLAQTADQTPSVPEERARLIALGGFVMHDPLAGKPRAAGILAISRAFGNAGLKPFVNAEPAVLRVPLPRCACTLLVASDGLFDVLSSAEAVRNLHARARAPAATLAMRAKAHERASDNITALVCTIGAAAEEATQPLPATQPPDVVQASGGGGAAAAAESPTVRSQSPVGAASATAPQQCSKRKLGAMLGAAAALPSPAATAVLPAA
jgi:protein phosphatase 1L